MPAAEPVAAQAASLSALKKDDRPGSGPGHRMRASAGKARKWMVRGQGWGWEDGRAAMSWRVASGTWLRVK
jgi:hypothetical protein